MSRKPRGGKAPVYSGRTGSMSSLALLACVELWPAQTPRTGWMRSVHTATHTPLHWTEGLSSTNLPSTAGIDGSDSCCLTPTEEPPQYSSCHRDCCLSLVHRKPSTWRQLCCLSHKWRLTACLHPKPWLLAGVTNQQQTLLVYLLISNQYFLKL